MKNYMIGILLISFVIVLYLPIFGLPLNILIGIGSILIGVVSLTLIYILVNTIGWFVLKKMGDEGDWFDPINLGAGTGILIVCYLLGAISYLVGTGVLKLING